MAEVNQSVKEEVIKTVKEFFAEECEIDANDITDKTRVIEDLEGDSLMFLELLEIFKKKYNLNVELKSIGKYVVKHPAETIKDIIDMTLLIIEHEDQIASL